MKLPAALIAIALFSMVLVGCAQSQHAVETSAQPEPVESGPAPALWRIADEDTTIWLFGTIHVLPTGHQWRTDTIDAAIAGSDELVLETVISGDQGEAAALLMQYGITPGLPPLAERVSPEKRATLAEMIARGPLPAEFLNGVETWTAGLLLVGVTLSDIGLNSDNGVEEQLQLLFRQDNRPISGFETPAQQLGFFDGLPEDAQRFFLESVIDSPESVRSEYETMLDSWTRGNEDAIAESFDDEIAFSDTLREVLLIGRNADWAQQIAARLEAPGTVFVAVGAGHLVGDGSVQDFLEGTGITTTRIQ